MTSRRLLILVTLCICACGEGPAPAGSGSTSHARSDSGAQHSISNSRPQTDTDLYDMVVSPDSVGELDRFIVLGLRRFGESYREIVSTIGAPDRVVVEPFANRHVAGQVDSVVTAYWKDARVSVYRVTNGSDLVSNITVYDNSYFLLPTLRIGMAWDSVASRFGTPHFADAYEYRWSCSVCVVDQQVVIEVAGGKITSVGFDYYID